MVKDNPFSTAHVVRPENVLSQEGGAGVVVVSVGVVDVGNVVWANDVVTSLPSCAETRASNRRRTRIPTIRMTALDSVIYT